MPIADKDTVRLIEKPPSREIVGVGPVQFEGNLVEVAFDSSTGFNLITVSGIKSRETIITIGSELQTFT